MKKLFVFLALSALYSCSNDTSEAPLGSYDNGILILNEGGAGTVTFIGEDLQTVQQEIFTLLNGQQQDLGQYAQSIFFDGARAFVISNGSNKITVVNRYSFEYIATISTGLSVPRYGAVANGKAYVTNMASFFDDADDYVAVIDLEDLTVGAPIPMNRVADRIESGGGKIWVANGAFGSGDAVTVIDPETVAVTATILTGMAPNSLEYRDGVLYALCASIDGQAKMVRIDAQDEEITGSVTIPGMYAVNLDIEGNLAYFTAGSKIYAMPMQAATFTAAPLVDTMSGSNYIGYGFAVGNGRIYISEAADDFISNGRVLVYDLSGNEIANIPTGLGPNGIYFN